MHQKIPDRQKLQTRAAILAAADELSDNEIARQCGISRRTLMRWKKQPAMEQKIDEYLKCIQRHSEVRMIAERQQRITPLDIRMRELQAVIQSRANSPEMQGVPGGKTGLLRRRKAAFRQGQGSPEVYNYQLDIPLLREMRKLEVAAAQAVGQWPTPKYQPAAVGASLAVPSGKQHRAALLIADGTRADVDVAADCGINRRTLARWKEQPSFRARVAEARSTVLG